MTRTYKRFSKWKDSAVFKKRNRVSLRRSRLERETKKKIITTFFLCMSSFKKIKNRKTKSRVIDQVL